MTRGKGKAKILSQGERESIVGLKQEAESNLREAKQYGAGTQATGIDQSKIVAEIKHYDKVLAEGTAPKVRGSVKDEMRAEVKELQAKLQAGLPTRYEMDNPGRCPGAVHKHLNWMKRNDSNVARFREIQRTLEPDDPTATDIERLRTEK